MSMATKRPSAKHVVPHVAKPKPAVSFKGYKAFCRKEPRLCYSVSKPAKENSSSWISSEDKTVRRGLSQSRAARRSASVTGVSRTRSSLAERPRPGHNTTTDDLLLHSEVQPKNSCLNAVEMHSGIDDSLMSGPDPLKTPRCNRSTPAPSILRTFTSNSSGYGSMLPDCSMDEGSAISLARKSKIVKTAEEPFFHQQTFSRRRLRSFSRPASHEDMDDLFIEDLLTALSKKLRRIGDQLVDPLFRRAFAEVEIDIQDLRVQCGEAHKWRKDNRILRKRINVVQCLFEEERGKAAEERQELLMLLDFAREENQTLVTALRGCSRLNGGEKIDAEIQTAPDTKDASTDAEPFAGELDENAPTRIAPSQNTPLVKNTKRLSPTSDGPSYDLREQHANCRVRETSSALKDILNVLDTIPAEKPQSPLCSKSIDAAVVMLTKENLFEHERRYLNEKVSNGSSAAKLKAGSEPLKVTDEIEDKMSDGTLVEARSSSGQSTRVAYMPDNASVISHFSASTSTLSSLKSRDHRLFQDGITHLHQQLLKVERNFPKPATVSYLGR